MSDLKSITKPESKPAVQQFAAESQDVTSLREQAELKASLEKAVCVRTQEVADKMYPRQPSDKRFSVVLGDGNGHPSVLLWAYSDHDAIARYFAVCGINSSEKRPTVTLVQGA